RRSTSRTPPSFLTRAVPVSLTATLCSTLAPQLSQAQHKTATFHTLGTQSHIVILCVSTTPPRTQPPSTPKSARHEQPSAPAQRSSCPPAPRPAPPPEPA